MSPRRKQERSKASHGQVLKAALGLFSSRGFGATSMREIADSSGLSMGNLYHHFPNKEAIFRQLLADYWKRLSDPEHPLQQLFARASFPEDLEEMAAEIEAVVEDNASYILLIYVDVVEFRGEHIRAFYEGMAARFQEIYGAKLEVRKAAGEIGDVDPLVAVILATRWLFYFFTVEKCFGAPMHFGMKPQKATEEFIRLLRFGLLPRSDGSAEGQAEKQGRPDARATKPPSEADGAV